MVQNSDLNDELEKPSDTKHEFFEVLATELDTAAEFATGDQVFLDPGEALRVRFVIHATYEGWTWFIAIIDLDAR